MPHVFWIIGLTLLLTAGLLTAGTAAAQQCRSVYRLGETVPPGCQDRLRTGLPAYQQWGEGFGGTVATPSRSPATPAPHPEWRYFGGYNALYGFGR
jgi:hypothetical protein